MGKMKNKNFQDSKKKYVGGNSVIVTMYGKVDVVERREDGSIVGKMWKLADDSYAKIYLPPEPKLAAPSKKFALIVGYNGDGFSGSQANPKVRTVEGDLERALYDAKLISRNNFSRGLNLNKIKWSRAARTDKGVHALGNLFAMKFANLKDVDFPTLINKHLPKNIRVLKCLRVKKGFSAKNACDNRTYEYLLPIYMLNAPCNPDLVASRSDGWTNGARFDVGRRESLYRHAFSSSSNGNEINGTSTTETTVSPLSETVSRLRQVLKRFEGTHTFHNYTRRLSGKFYFLLLFNLTLSVCVCVVCLLNFTSSYNFSITRTGTDAQALRLIRSFRCSDPFELQGSMYVRLYVKGQSFLYNQIRKMVGTAIYIMRGIIPMSFMELTFSSQINTVLPKAPAEGLMLRCPHYDHYNGKLQDGHEEIDVLESETQRKARAFCDEVIYPTMLSSVGVFSKWMQSTDDTLLEIDLPRKWREIEVRYRYERSYFRPPRIDKKRKTGSNKRPRENRGGGKGGGSRLRNNSNNNKRRRGQNWKKKRK